MGLMFASLIIIFSGAFIAPILCRIVPKICHWILAGLPFLSFCLLLRNAGETLSGNPAIETYKWVDTLNFNLQLQLDGLSLLFALLITGIGGLIVIYAGGYLSTEAKSKPAFFFYLFLFMGAMLGMVLSDNVFMLFIFWELTSISSYLLIGFRHGEEQARKSATQALLLTSIGGLALIAGLILASNAAGSPNFSAWVTNSDALTNSDHFGLMLTLLLLGAFTKSAQVPFHFWLPNAMVAPAPVSAFLHSATMVKAGVYLLARLNPFFTHSQYWHTTLLIVGGITMVTGAVWAMFQSDIKKILAYTTIAGLGIIVFVLGIGTSIAVKGLVVFLVAHAFYKGALFMIAGNIDHAIGTRDIRQLSALFRKMPVTGIATVLVALSMAGLPFFAGFISKELIYEAATLYGVSKFLLVPLIITNSLFVVVSLWLGWKILSGSPDKVNRQTQHSVHEVNAAMFIGPLLLGLLGFLIVLFPNFSIQHLFSLAATEISGQSEILDLHFFPEINLIFGLSVVTLLSGWVIYKFHGKIFGKLNDLICSLERFGPENIYEKGWQKLLRFSALLTGFIQSGYLRFYIFSIITSFVLLIFFTIDHYGASEMNLSFSGVEIYEVLMVVMIVVAMIFVLLSTSRLISVVLLGMVGYGVAMVYAIHGGVDLAMTQFLIETLTVAVFVFILYKLPGYESFSSLAQRWRDLLVALCGGATITAVILMITGHPLNSELKKFYAENSLSLGKGRNVVNVILVDFRALDTLGEITVLCIAALGVFTLIKLNTKKPG